MAAGTSTTIRIYDIDGTLNYTRDEVDDTSGFDTYAYWPLISYHFAKSPDELKAQAQAWDSSDKGTGEAFIDSSAMMLQRSIEHFKAGISADDVRARGQEITRILLKHGGVRQKAILHLRKSLEDGHICILSTGSYHDGAMGLVDELVHHGFIPEVLRSNLIVTGAQIDWPERKVVHANIAENKILSIKAALAARGCKLERSAIDFIAVDDPLGNDLGLCQLNPEAVYVIKTPKNAMLRLDARYTHCSWDEIWGSPTTYTHYVASVLNKSDGTDAHSPGLDIS